MRPIICLTPIKNEAWILERFLECTSLWADHIIVADQNSTDGSQEIVRRFPKAKLIQNSSSEYNEVDRQRLLINEARKITDDGILIALDADEILGGDWEKSAEWSRMKKSSRGTGVLLARINLFPRAQKYWCPETLPFGFIDDGREHLGKWIHSYRIPFLDDMPSLTLKDVKVLHYQYIDWPRMLSKHRWYQCLETIKAPSRSFVEIYRQYHHMNAIPHEQIGNVDENWFVRYKSSGIELPSAQPQSYYWWDIESLRMFAKHGIQRFRRLAIWDIKWEPIQAAISESHLPRLNLSDPRSFIERLVHFYLRLSQKYRNKATQKIDKFLVRFGW
jgi:glycosyltransferase involved in cell wall biosynthesis